MILAIWNREPQDYCHIDSGPISAVLDFKSITDTRE
jgi:hypothetical protein